MNLPRLVAVSDLTHLPGPLEDWLAELAGWGVEALWLREKYLADGELLALAEHCRRRLPPSVRLLLSARPDLALLSRAEGVHLPASGLPVQAVRSLGDRLGRRLLVGRSTHSEAEVRAAQAEGVDYVTFGPVYPTPAKAAFGPPRGELELGRVVSLGVPVLALGGVEAHHAAPLRALGVAGIAAQRAFQAGATARAVVAAFGRRR